MWIKRDISPVVERLFAQRPTVVLTGARQTGKTSLVRRLFADASYVSLDLPATASAAEDEPEAFLALHPPPTVIDEVQYAPGLFRNLKSAIDRDRDRMGQFVLTGSQKFLLMREVSDSLAGRTAVLDLEPLSLGEIHGALPAFTTDDAIVRGGYPELYKYPDLDPQEYFASYVATYLERDVRSLLRVGSLRDFERFVRACALRSAQVLNKAELGRDVGVSAPTANEWLSVLQASGQIHLLEPWFVNRTRSMTKSPKLYLADTGLLCFLLGIRTADELHASPYRGAVWETFVHDELRKRFALESPGNPVYFWRDRNKEVDFLVHRAGFVEAIEAKWSERPSSGDAAGFAAMEKRVANVTRRTIVCRTPRPLTIAEGVRAVGPTDPWLGEG